MSDESLPEFDAALIRLLEGEAEPGDGEQMKQSLLDSPDALRKTTGLLMVDDLLRQQADVMPDAFVEAFRTRITAERRPTVFVRSVEKRIKQPASRRSPARAGRVVKRVVPRYQASWWSRLFPDWAKALASLIAAGVVAMLFIQNRQSRPPVASGSLCEVVQTVGAVSVANGKVVQPGQALYAGPMEVSAGLVELRFPRGAVLVIEGPARIDLAATDKVFLHAGKVAAEVPAAAIGFSVETPTAMVVDHGTRFGVSVGGNGHTETHVFEGIVEMAPAGKVKGSQRELKRDMAAAIDPAMGTFNLIRCIPDRFPQPSQVVNRLLANGDFEPGTELPPPIGRPWAFAQWNGDVCKLVGPTGEIVPQAGRGMLQFMRPDSRALPRRESGVKASIYQLVDLRPLHELLAHGGVQAEVSAWFNRGRERDSEGHFTLAAQSYHGSISDLRNEMRESETRADQTNAHQSVTTDEDPSTWQRAEARVSLAPDSDILVVGLHAFKSKTRAPLSAHFVDTVEVRIVIPPRPSSPTTRR